MPMRLTTSRRGTASVLAAATGLAIAGCAAGPADLGQPTAQRATGSVSAPPSPEATASGGTVSTRMAPLTGLPATGPRRRPGSGGRAADR